MPFPSSGPFLWGASTAAHQTEGGNVNTDWWVNENSADPGHITEPSNDAADSYHRYKEEMTLLANPKAPPRTRRCRTNADRLGVLPCGARTRCPKRLGAQRWCAHLRHGERHRDH